MTRVGAEFRCHRNPHNVEDVRAPPVSVGNYASANFPPKNFTMGVADQSVPSKVSHPELRRELLLYLEELGVDDPRPIWEEERRRGLVSDIDQVFHFFFDDHDFDASDIGRVLLNEEEVKAIAAVKGALDAVLDAVGDKGGDAFVEHPLWPNVTRAAARAVSRLTAAQ